MPIPPAKTSVISSSELLNTVDNDDGEDVEVYL